VRSGSHLPKFQSITRISLRFFAALLGLGLLGYLVSRTGPGVVWKQVQAVGWGFSLIIILGGFSQLTATAGLTLALCRRARTVFWAAVGAIYIWS